jgi:hypothetical protein
MSFISIEFHHILLSYPKNYVNYTHSRNKGRASGAVAPGAVHVGAQSE